MSEKTLHSGQTPEGNAYQVVSQRKYRLSVSAHIWLRIYSRFDRQLIIYCKRFARTPDALQTAETFTVSAWLEQLKKELGNFSKIN